MIIICGLSGSGKTTLSKKFVNGCGFKYFNDWELTNLKIFLQKLVLYADKSLINTSKNASIFCNRCKKF